MMIIKRTCLFPLLVVLLSACSWLPAPSTGKVPTETLAPTPTGTVRVAETKAPALTPDATQTASPTTAPTKEPALPTIEPPAPTPLPVRYGVQYGTPAGLANFVAPEAGCAWFGIGGQAFDLSGNPVSSLVVEVGGVLAGKEISKLSMSGSSSSIGSGWIRDAIGGQTICQRWDPVGATDRPGRSALDQGDLLHHLQRLREKPGAD